MGEGEVMPGNNRRPKTPRQNFFFCVDHAGHKVAAHWLAKEDIRGRT